MTEVKLSSKYQIVVPRVARKKLGLRPGDRLTVSVEGDRIVLVRGGANAAEALRGIFAGLYGDVRQYLAEEKDSWER